MPTSNDTPNPNSVPTAPLPNRYPFYGRVEWVVPSGKSKDGLLYYRTLVVSPSFDPYDPPARRVILSEGQFAKPGQEVGGFFSTSLKPRTSDVTDKKTGEVTKVSFYPHDLWLVR
jgi:hypothetical protein